MTTQPGRLARARRERRRSRSRSPRSGRRTPGCRRSRPRCACAKSSSSEPAGSTSRLLAGGEHLVRLVLRRLHVGLVERVDPEDRAGDRGRELPAEELLAELVRRRRRAPPAPGGRGRPAARPAPGTRPLPCLPVDSASSCSAQRPKPPRVRAMQTLSRPSRQPSPSERPSSRPGLPSARRHASAISLARSEQPRRRRRPSAPPAPSRTARAPSSGRRSSARRGRSRANSRSRASCSSAEPGSVIAAQCSPFAGSAPRSSRCASASRASSPTSTRR